MDPVFDAQFRIISDAFAARDVEIAVRYAPSGAVDYVYQAHHLLVAEGDDGDGVGRVDAVLPGVGRTQAHQPVGRGLALLDLREVRGGAYTVPEALRAVDDVHGGDRRPGPGPLEPPVLAAPNHVMHIARLCSAIEPEVPGGRPAAPWPAPRPASGGFGALGRAARIGVCDTGLLAADDRGPAAPWLEGVTGDEDPLGGPTPGDVARIPAFTGHGTFVAGMARAFAPDADVRVTDHFSTSGAELESAMIAKLEQLVADYDPDVVNLSAGTYTRRHWTCLGFDVFHTNHPDVVLVAAAGNDGTDRPMYPAAYDWVVSVGALGPDQRHRAWFSNYGPTVDVYALGEGLVNAYARGEYAYTEPPKRPAVQAFDGLARWDGTSFSAPVVAGLIAARMARTGESSAVAAQAVLDAARAQAIPHVGPALFIDDTP
jgi:subtilisin family serine protease